MSKSNQLTVKSIQSKIASNNVGKHPDGNGLYFVIPKSGSPYWMLRYTAANKKRKGMTIGKHVDMSLQEARYEAALKKSNIETGRIHCLQKTSGAGKHQDSWWSISRLVSNAWIKTKASRNTKAYLQ